MDIDIGAAPGAWPFAFREISADHALDLGHQSFGSGSPLGQDLMKRTSPSI
jgi:hypothetical protein